jgi:outer membrane scaffolding protein for murein synthesis (MipA/OmpV family)
MPRIYALAVAATVLVCAQRPASAQVIQQQVLEQQDLTQQQPSPGSWSVTLGAGIGTAPVYPGADTDKVRAIPLAQIVYDKTLFIGTEGIGLNLINSHGFRAGPLLSYIGGRNEDSDPRLNGLGDIHASLTAGAFASYRVGRFEFGATVRQAVTQTDNGLVGLVQADYLIPLLNRRTLITFGPDLEFANARYDQTWFGVTGSQSLSSGLPLFSPGAGVRDVGVHATLTHHYTEHFTLRAFISAKEITGDDANSPLIENRTQVLFGVGLAYHF